MSYADKQTDKALNGLIGQITTVYDDALSEVSKTASDYFASYRERFEKEKKAYEDGKYTKEQFYNWQVSQLGRGERWFKVRDDIAQRLTDANKVAAAYVNDTTPGIYTLNANYSAYEIEQETGVAFDIYDEQTVKGLLTGQTKIIPSSRVKDADSNAWNEKKLTNALTSAILQGKDIGQIADAFQSVADMNRNAAIRNARTSITTAENAGRQASYEQAHDLGIEIKKEWIATEDDRTRDSHAELDGVQVPYDKPYPNGLMYPGDQNGEPSEFYNCRCTERAIIPKYNGQQRTSDIDGHKGDHTEETYKEWLDRKREEKMRNSKPTTSADASFRAMEEKDKQLPKATDRASANELLEKECGFYVDSTTKKINEKLYVDSTNQLIKLEDRFGVCHDALNTSIISSASGNAEAYVSNPATNPLSMKLSLCPRAYKDYDTHIATLEGQIGRRWAMPCAKENYSVYDVTHEYGHMLENIFVSQYYKDNGWSASNPSEFYNADAKTKAARVKWYSKNEAECAKGIWEEIVDIAKSNNPDFSLADNLSRYGQSSYFEAFAETFANSQCGEPNELGAAMEQWLVSKGY